MTQCCFATLLMLPLVVAAAEEKLSIKKEKVAIPTEIDAKLRTLLDDEAIVIRAGDDNVCGVIWLRKEIPAQASAEQIKNGLTYREIAAGTLIGAVRWNRKWIDFRKQEIPAGVYTLRLGFQPADTDHMGTAPHTEFCLLSSAAKDTSPAIMEVKPLIEMSAASHDAKHPAVLLLFPNNEPSDEPKLAHKDNGIDLVNVIRIVTAANEKTTLGFGLVVKGQRKDKD